ncbi:MAG: fibronectin type III domain-containing protein [Rikenellaceae bacterium]|nr:fibronectin type III domain-containing protein [Rikenellaceae bacterium]
MKNIFRRVASMLAVAFVAAMSLVACSEEEVAEPNRLAAPEVDVVFRSESFDVTWKAVDGADGYVYSLNGAEEQTTTATSLKFEGLKFGSNNTLKIKAVDSSKAFADSEWKNVSLTLNTAFKLGEIELKVSNQTESSFVVSWNAAEGAEYYEVALATSSTIEKVSGLQKEFTGLAEGVYHVRVRPATSDADYAPAAWVSIAAKTQESIADELAANSYLIEEAGAYVFAPFKGNSGEAVENIAGVGLLWQDTPGLITEAGLVDGKVRFVVAEGVYGNAVVYAYGAGGNEEILWSWHVWVPEQQVESLPMITGFNVMNMNLGATTAAAADINAFGLCYQWGRKDPFTGSPTLSGTTATLAKPIYNIDGEEGEFDAVMTPQSVEFAIANPGTFISPYGVDYADWCSTSDDALWGNPDGNYREQGSLKYYNLGEKSMYDPCPAGWRVPPIMAFSKFTSTGAAVMGNYASTAVADRNGDGVVDTNDYNCGYYMTLSGTTTTFFPAASRWYGAYAALYGSVVGHSGVYWSNSVYKSSIASQAESKQATACLTFMSPAYAGTCFVSANSGGARSDASSVRCVADKE